MTPTLEQLLYLQAQEDSNSLVSPELASGVGAALGAYSGLQYGNQVHKMGNAINKRKDALAAKRGLTPVKKRLKPGNRMAGLLAGAVLGGIGGNELREALIGESPAARLLAKIQVGAELTPTEMQVLENVATKQLMA